MSNFEQITCPIVSTMAAHFLRSCTNARALARSQNHKLQCKRGPQMNQIAIEATATEAYAETRKLLANIEMASVVKQGLNILYGPPMSSPDMAIITFQGGGEDNVIQKSWPKRLLYLHDSFKFGTMLRKYAALANLSSVLQTRTIAMAAIFPQSPSDTASTWMSSSGPKARWREFSSDWVSRLLASKTKSNIGLRRKSFRGHGH